MPKTLLQGNRREGACHVTQDHGVQTVSLRQGSPGEDKECTSLYLHGNTTKKGQMHCSKRLFNPREKDP